MFDFATWKSDTCSDAKQTTVLLASDNLVNLIECKVPLVVGSSRITIGSELDVYEMAQMAASSVEQVASILASISTLFTPF